VDFEKVKSLLLSLQDMEEFIRSKEDEEEAMFLFWALHNLESKNKDLSIDALNRLKKNSEILREAQEFIFTEDLAASINKFSHGFVLGVLEYAARTKEAQIEHYSDYKELVKKIESMKELGFPSEKFQKYWEETIIGIKEIQGYMTARSDDHFPILTRLINTQKYKTPSKTLKMLRKGRSDNGVFQILASVLHSNPILDERLKELCIERSISLDHVKDQLTTVLQLLEDDSQDKKVQEYCRLLLGHKRK
jgi:hypothetical protein